MLHTTTVVNGKVNGVVTGMASPVPPQSPQDSTTNSNSSSATATTAKRVKERENLRNIIAQWNANRLDLFEISEPNEDLEFYGVMRFYFQDAGQKVATKCMRISSTAGTVDVISNLIEKFRPDIRMLSVPEYALYEIHENGEERKLGDEEMPLLVQLNWHKDDREGRFLLRRMDEKTYLPGFGTENSNFLNRKLSKREKKEKKKREKKEKAAGKANGDKGKDSLAEKLYTELPETSFTRSISNPEAVMRRRRQQKLEKKLQQFSQEGGADAGGTLRIFGESINQDVPYKTILLSTRDTAAFAVKEILEKYGKEKEDSAQYCLVQIVVPFMNGEAANLANGAVASKSLPDANVREYILDDDDCPLIIERSHLKSRGVLTFHIRRRPPDYQPRKRKKMPGQFVEPVTPEPMVHGKNVTLGDNVNNAKMLPYLVEVNPDGSDLARSGAAPRRHYLYMNVTEVGSEVSNNSASEAMPNASKITPNRNSLQLFGPNVQPRHCVIAHTEGIITVTPCNREAETFVNGTRIYETTILKHGMLVRFGKLHTFKFLDELTMRRHSQLSSGAIIGQHFPQQQPNNNSQQPAMNGSDFGGVAPYETTFDADGKVETSSAGKGVEPGSPFVNSGSLQRHHTVGSLPRSASDNGSNHNGNSDVVPPANASQRNSTAGASINSNSLIRKGDNILPAILEVWEEIEDLFLNMIIKRVDPNQVQFKLCITYTLYMVTRYRASTYFKPEITPEARANRLIAFCIKYSHLIQQTINENHREQSFLAFWLANSSELLHFLKNDRHLSAFTFDSQDILAEAVQLAFSCLVSCQHHELQDALSTFSEDIVDQSDQSMSAMTNKVLNVLSNSMQLLRRFRVNAALTIQLFSQLFHFINMWLFNKVIGTPSSNFCSRQFGLRFKNCLVQIELWAEKQGLELAAECHLSRIVQTAQFLQAPKNSSDELGALVANFYKLNSLQLRALFERYKPMPDEVSFSAEHIESVIKMARSTTDELILKEGREIRLEEETDLQLPFLLPEDGYSCDIVRGIPAGLQEFVQTLVQARVCNLTIQPTASGCWTIYFINFQPEPIGMMVTQDFPPSANDETFKKQIEASPVIQKNVPVSMPDNINTKAPTPNTQFVSNAQQQQQMMNNQSGAQFMGPKGGMVPVGAQPMQGQKQPGMMPNMVSGYPGYNSLRGMPEPEVQILKLQKSNNGMGLSIVAARGTNQSQLGIYIKSVVKGGAADLDGRLEAGDQLLKVDGHSLIGITQERAAELMTQTGPIVTLEVAKQGALFHGLGGILTQQASASAILNKNVAAMRARDMQRFNQDFGPHRMNGQHIPASMHPQFSPQHSRIPVNAAGFPTYNSMPGPLTYNQMAANYRNQMQNGSSMPLNYNNTPNMRPDSQLSYNSQSNALNSPLAAPANRISMSTASLPASQQQQPPPPHMYEERHYQNIQLYQVNSGQANNQISNNTNQIPKLSPNIPPHQNLIGNTLAARPMVHGSHSSLQQQQPVIVDQNLQPPSRPVSAIVTSREQEQIFTSSVAFTSPGTPTSVTSRQPNGPEFFNYPQPQQAQSNFPFDPAQQQQHQLDQQMRHQRDLMRQEAKMEEIREELRRREDRMQHQPNSYLGTIPRGMSLSNAAMGPPNSVRPVRFVSQQTLANGNQLINNQNQSAGTLRHPSQLNMNRAGPPAPAPKPARPMNLNNSNANQINNTNGQPATQVSYRYGPSGYPPVASSKSANSLTNSKNDIPSSGIVSPSPWEREEKEKELQQKIDETRKTRDEEIKYLESVPYRNTKHEERLKKLILEREFQRRADEHQVDEDEEEDDAMLERADNRERMLSLKQDIERSRQRRMDMRYAGDTKLNKTLEEQEERLKLLRLEEEATQQAEERLLQEAKKRQEDEMKVGKGILKQPNQSNNGGNDGGGDIPPPLPKSPPPIESANQRLDRLLLSTASKTNINEINDESAMNSMPVRSGVLKNPNLYNGDGPISDRSVKKVSWNDNPSTTVLNESEHSDEDADEEEEGEEEEDDDHNEDRFSLQDIDDVLGDQGGGSKDWSNNYVSGNTPGVIGSQEVYNDPRKRIEAERLKSNQSQTSSEKVPEKLSFQEKMKMFAKSTDSLEDGPLRNKMKTSKAQREIEGGGGNGSANGLYDDSKN